MDNKLTTSPEEDKSSPQANKPDITKSQSKVYSLLHAIDVYSENTIPDSVWLLQLFLQLFLYGSFFSYEIP